MYLSDDGPTLEQAERSAVRMADITAQFYNALINGGVPEEAAAHITGQWVVSMACECDEGEE